MKVLCLAAAFVLAGFMLVSAQAQEQASPPPDAVKLRALLGHWTGTGEIRAGKDIQLVTLMLNCDDAAAGWGILCEESLIGKELNYHASSVMGYDARSGLVHWFVVANDGETHDRTGQWKDEREFIANSTSNAGGKPAMENITLEMTGVGAMKEIVATTRGGEQSRTMTLTLQKSGQQKSLNPFKARSRG